MITLWIFSFITCFGYIAYNKIKRPETSCISHTYYDLTPKGWLFTAWAIFTGVSLLPIWLEITPEDYQFVAFLSVVALGIVGLAPRYLHNQTVLHLGAAIIAVALSALWSCLGGLWWMLLVCYLPTVVLILSLRRGSDWLYWIEVAALLNNYLAILMIILKN